MVQWEVIAVEEEAGRQRVSGVCASLGGFAINVFEGGSQGDGPAWVVDCKPLGIGLEFLGPEVREVEAAKAAALVRLGQKLRPLLACLFPLVWERKSPMEVGLYLGPIQLARVVTHLNGKSSWDFAGVKLPGNPCVSEEAGCMAAEGAVYAVLAGTYGAEQVCQ